MLERPAAAATPSRRLSGWGCRLSGWGWAEDVALAEGGRLSVRARAPSAWGLGWTSGPRSIRIERREPSAGDIGPALAVRIPRACVETPIILGLHHAPAMAPQGPK